MDNYDDYQKMTYGLKKVGYIGKNKEKEQSKDNDNKTVAIKITSK